MKRPRLLLCLLIVLASLAAPAAGHPASASAPGASGCADAEAAVSSSRGMAVALCPDMIVPEGAIRPEVVPVPLPAGPCNPSAERCEAWVSAPYDGPAAGNDYVGERGKPQGNLAGNAVATTSDGTVVVTAGTSERAGQQWAVVTLAYDAANGTRLWTETLEPSGGATELNAVSVVAGADTVFVTGYALADGEGTGFTRAYDARSGVTRWHRTFPGWANHSALSEDGTRLFVAGDARLKNGQWEGRIVSYDTLTGEQVWLQTITDPKGWPVMPWRIDTRGDRASVAISRFVPDGPEAGVTKAVIVATFDATGENEGMQVSKVGMPVEGALPAGLTLNADGSRAFVPVSVDAPLLPDAATLVFAVDTAAGDVVWERYLLGWDPNGVAGTTTYPWHYHPIEVSPRGSVVVAMYSVPYGVTGTFVTVSLNAETGREEWQASEPQSDHYAQTPGWYGPTVSVNPVTGQVVVSGAMLLGNRLRPVTFGYSSTGQREWRRISIEPPAGSTLPLSEGHWPALVHSPDGTRVYEAGTTMAVFNDPASSPDMIVAAFDTAA